MLTQGNLTQIKLTQKRLTQFSPYVDWRRYLPQSLFWYEADLVEKDLSDAVSILYDKSGKNFHLVQATQVNKPLLIENYQNGQPALRFDGVNDFMRVAFGQTFAQPTTIYVIWNRSSSGISQNIVIDGLDTNNRHSLYNSNNVNGIFTTAAISYSKTPPFSLILNKAVFNGSMSQFYENNTLRVSGNVGTQPLTGLSLGSRFSNVDFLNGHILALLGFNRLLSFSEDLNVMNYLNQKYGVF